MKIRKIIALSGFIGFFVLFVLLCILLNFDKAYIGPTGKSVGLSHFNRLFYNGNENDDWSKVSDLCLFISLIYIVVMAFIGLIELIKRRSLLKVDPIVLILGGFSLVLLLVYFVFDHLIIINYRPRLIINYRPRLINGEIEHSFPSTHTMFTVFLTLTFVHMMERRYKFGFIFILTAIFAVLNISFVMAGRINSSYHWATDVLGGFLMGVSLAFGVVWLDIVVREKKGITD